MHIFEACAIHNAKSGPFSTAYFVGMEHLNSYHVFCNILFLLATVDCHKISKKRELEKAVAEIGDWEVLCENLGVPSPVLQGLRYDNIQNSMKKTRCLEAYLNTGTACWETVVEVVADVPFYNKRVAKEIADKYGVDYSKYVKDEL